jgi:hypothetical protein
MNGGGPGTPNPYVGNIVPGPIQRNWALAVEGIVVRAATLMKANMSER